MAVRVSESEVQRLARVYRDAVKDLAREFVSNVSIREPDLSMLIAQAMETLNQLDVKAATWARRNIEKLYEAANAEMRRKMRAFGLLEPSSDRAAWFTIINRQAIEALVMDPDVGFLYSMHAATEQIKARMRLIQNQAKLLRSQQHVLDEVIARVGILEGKAIDKVTAALVKELTSMKPTEELVWKPALAKLGPDHLMANLANLPFVKIPTGTGERFLRIDHYAEMLGRTKMAQALTLARRNALLEFGHDIVMFSLNMAIDDDACDLYLGRLFALSPSAAAELNIPRVEELPSGGTPLHPNCTHSEVPFFPEAESEDRLEAASSRPPAWALNQPWGLVNATYKRRGGLSFAMAQNPNMRFAKTTGGRERRRRNRRRRK